jgi:hypothetical protein
MSAATAAGGIVTILIGLEHINKVKFLGKKDILKDIIFPLIDKLDKSEKMYWAKSIRMK